MQNMKNKINVILIKMIQHGDYSQQISKSLFLYILNAFTYKSGPYLYIDL